MPNRVKLNQDYPVIEKSKALSKRAQGLIPAMTQTLAKGPTQHVQGVSPAFTVRGKGAHVWDADDNEYIDLSMAIGPVVLGYADPTVDAAIRRQLEDGITFSRVHPLEVRVAETLRELVPGAECVRFSKTGCDVTSAAVRLARAFTQREKVLSCGYHGWHDWSIAVTDRNAGIPQSTQDSSFTFAYNDLRSVIDGIDDTVACVILEPMVFEEPKPGFLQELKGVCEARGALLVFDEMWTGFRLALGGAQERFGVRADLACFSKAIANGMPLSALTGRQDVMRLLEKDVFFFTTFGGEALSLAAAEATLSELRTRHVPNRLEVTGLALRDGYNRLAQSLDLTFTSSVGMGCRSMVTFTQQGLAQSEEPRIVRSYVEQEMLRHGVLFGGFHNVCDALTETDVGHVLEAYKLVLADLAQKLRSGPLMPHLRGEPISPVFRKTSHFNVKPRNAQ